TATLQKCHTYVIFSTVLVLYTHPLASRLKSTLFEVHII
ncbi:MAG: hypothetical protein ACI9OH_001550, partial [Oleispira sp.]